MSQFVCLIEDQYVNNIFLYRSFFVISHNSICVACFLINILIKVYLFVIYVLRLTASTSLLQYPFIRYSPPGKNRSHILYKKIQVC